MAGHLVKSTGRALGPKPGARGAPRGCANKSPMCSKPSSRSRPYRARERQGGDRKGSDIALGLARLGHVPPGPRAEARRGHGPRPGCQRWRRGREDRRCRASRAARQAIAVSSCHTSDPRRSSFKSIALMLWGVSWSPNRSGATSCWRLFASLPPCLVGLEASGSAHHWAR